jgi:hypothetical protein
MTWLPIGPNFVFAPRDTSFKRLSRRNEAGQQGRVSAIAVDPTDADHIYVVCDNLSSDAAAFHSGDGGATWDAISDALQQADPTVLPKVIAVNPSNPAIIYLATQDGRCFTSSARGAVGSWSVAATLGGAISTLLVDPNTAAIPATTVLYASGTDGVWQSTPGGGSFTQVQAGAVKGFVGDFTTPGTPLLYAGVTSQGVMFSNSPRSSWTNLNTLGIGLPPPATNFYEILLARCPANGRLYALFTQFNPAQGLENAGLYTTVAPQSAWTPVASASLPQPGNDVLEFTVAPNSPGDGLTDVLFYGTVGLYRSTTSGVTWVQATDDFHADHRAFAAATSNSAVPVLFIGCDGGLARSDQWADPGFAFGQTFADFDSQTDLPDTGAPENLNHGLQSSLCQAYGAPSAVPAVGYIGCQDTGLSGGAGSLGWRGLTNGDCSGVAASPGPNGMSVWSEAGVYLGAWPPARLLLSTDQGRYASPSALVTMAAAGNSWLSPASNIMIGLDGLALAGVWGRNQVTTLFAEISATGAQTVSVGSTAAFGDGAVLIIDTEQVVASDVMGTTFTATFNLPHGAGAPVVWQRTVVARMDHGGGATQISQDFGNTRIGWVVASPIDPNQLYCVVQSPSGINQQIWQTASGSTANSGTVWTVMPAQNLGDYWNSSVTVDQAGSVFVLMKYPLNPSGGAPPIALFRLDTASWTPIACSGLPTPSFSASTIVGEFLANTVADPQQAGTLYTVVGASVFQVLITGDTAVWTSISEGLPGGQVYTLWAGSVTDVRSGGSPITLLRAAVPTRGVWELAIPDPSSAAPLLYVRDNVADLGWIDTARDGGADPYSSDRIWHYQCADIKIDAREPASGGAPAFFQTDPEYSTLPISQVAFDMLFDNSQNLPSGDAAMVHAQVHNRSTGVATGVNVWAIACNAAAGLPPLSTPSFDFWSQFQSGGAIVPALPPGSPWMSIGAPVPLPPVDAFHPQVASWNWTAPMLGPGDAGHYCIMAFVHCTASPLSLTVSDGDAATIASVQVGQKNLHIGPPLPASPGGGGHQRRPFREVVDFWNPTERVREATLVFDLRTLHPSIRSTLFFSRLDTVLPMPRAVTGYTKIVCDPLRHVDLLGSLLGAGPHVPGQVADRLRSFFSLGHESEPDDLPAGLPPVFEPVGWIGKRASVIEVRSVRIPPGERVRALLDLTTAGALEAGAAYRVEVQQTVDGRLAGGSTFVVRVAGAARASISAATPDTY